MIKFNKDQVFALCLKLNMTDKLVLVSDQGIYLMCFNEKTEKRTIVYAEGFDPSKDEEWFDNRYDVLPDGDDFGEEFCTAKAMLQMVALAEKHNKKHIAVKVTESSISVTAA